jgi:hypothetical protein
LPTRKRHSSTLPPTYHAQGQPRLDVCELPGPRRRARSAELIIDPPRRLSSPELDAHASSWLACMSSSRSDHVEREFGQNSIRRRHHQLRRESRRECALDCDAGVAGLRRRRRPRAETHGPLHQCGLAARVTRVRGVGSAGGFAAKPAPLASLI